MAKKIFLLALILGTAGLTLESAEARGLFGGINKVAEIQANSKVTLIKEHRNYIQLVASLQDARKTHTITSRDECYTAVETGKKGADAILNLSKAVTEIDRNGARIACRSVF
jgi:hypothetical protein